MSAPALATASTLRSVRWTVHGLPAPQGSARAFVHRDTGRAIVTHDNARTLGWRQEVAAALIAATGLPADTRPLWGRPTAVLVRATFYLPRPRSLPRRIAVPASRPDLDKLVRAALDAMTGLLYEDDAQVAAVGAVKLFGCARAEFFAEPFGGAEECDQALQRRLFEVTPWTA